VAFPLRDRAAVLASVFCVLLIASSIYVGFTAYSLNQSASSGCASPGGGCSANGVCGVPTSQYGGCGQPSAPSCGVGVRYSAGSSCGGQASTVSAESRGCGGPASPQGGCSPPPTASCGGKAGCGAEASIGSCGSLSVEQVMCPCRLLGCPGLRCTGCKPVKCDCGGDACRCGTYCSRGARPCPAPCKAPPPLDCRCPYRNCPRRGCGTVAPCSGVDCRARGCLGTACGSPGYLCGTFCSSGTRPCPTPCQPTPCRCGLRGCPGAGCVGCTSVDCVTAGCRGIGCQCGRYCSRGARPCTPVDCRTAGCGGLGCPCGNYCSNGARPCGTTMCGPIMCQCSAMYSCPRVGCGIGYCSVIHCGGTGGCGGSACGSPRYPCMTYCSRGTRPCPTPCQPTPCNCGLLNCPTATCLLTGGCIGIICNASGCRISTCPCGGFCGQGTQPCTQVYCYDTANPSGCVASGGSQASCSRQCPTPYFAQGSQPCGARPCPALCAPSPPCACLGTGCPTGCAGPGQPGGCLQAYNCGTDLQGCRGSACVCVSFCSRSPPPCRIVCDPANSCACGYLNCPRTVSCRSTGCGEESCKTFPHGCRGNTCACPRYCCGGTRPCGTATCGSCSCGFASCPSTCLPGCTSATCGCGGGACGPTRCPSHCSSGSRLCAATGTCTCTCGYHSCPPGCSVAACGGASVSCSCGWSSCGCNLQYSRCASAGPWACWQVVDCQTRGCGASNCNCGSYCSLRQPSQPCPGASNCGITYCWGINCPCFTYCSAVGSGCSSTQWSCAARGCGGGYNCAVRCPNVYSCNRGSPVTQCSYCTGPCLPVQ